MQGTDQPARTAAPEEDGADHIGYETPRSGVATPHPDPHDKRLPGIMTYFSQLHRLSVGLEAAQAPPSKWFSLQGLKELTRGLLIKSGPPTPTRALSTANSQSDGRDTTPNGSSNDGAETSGTVTPKNSGADAPAAKGKLTIKIVEARGIRKSRDPYVVAVFQRSELISEGPHAIEEEEQVVGTPSGLGSIPMKRQVSDSGRPMAIPMRSRQSSNTSISDYNTFRNRTSRTLFSSPKWDAEAVFDVVDSDMQVDISVYDHAASGEEFLGHVNLEARKDSPVKGWFALQGHANTTVENIPTGEIFVEVSYQRTEKKHFGPSDFEILKLIGKGTFGQVYQVRKKDTQRIYAMKVLQKKVIVQKKEVAHTVGERNILVRTATSDSPFIVGLKFSFQTPSELYLVTDYMSGGELFWHLQKEGRFDEKRAKFYIAELILAIQHLHNNDIVYRDLKPENILLDANGHIALCDFGLSKANLTKNDTTNTFCGTTEYLAPEVLLDESGYTKMVDFWSLGVLVFEMCCGWSPFYAEDTQQMYKNIAFGKVRFPRDTLSQEGRNFVKGLLNRNPKHRLGATDDAEELKRHPFFNDIDWNLLAKKLITPPFKPKLKSATDVSYFDPEFTTALDQNGSLNERAAALARGYAASTPLSPSVQANFHGFTYVDESALDDHMRDFRNDDEHMDDAHANGDDDWDNLDDIDPRASNRMSGIVRSGHDEQMVGGSHFDP
ncbi:serine/threonine-protein kinase SCH9 [Trichoderma asperellum]|uniref:non-specific serine/threonine protein kinase n=1 Tax=Trichoderma asperellum TaxID=101201 RepID=A0A6V8QTV6_TRIAP|nr:serine/threonine-protein kinase SCH9 [Trichoderma asperellum]